MDDAEIAVCSGSQMQVKSVSTEFPRAACQLVAIVACCDHMSVTARSWAMTAQTYCWADDSLKYFLKMTTNYAYLAPVLKFPPSQPMHS